jgi:hypothetical protein
MFCVCVVKGKPFFFVLGNCLNKDPCHMWMGSLLKWWTTNKIDTNVHIDKSHFFQKHSNMGCGVHPPHVMTKLKRDENLVCLISASKVSYAKGLKDV